MQQKKVKRNHFKLTMCGFLSSLMTCDVYSVFKSRPALR